MRISPLDSPLTDSGTCMTKLESTALMMCMVCVHGHSPLCLVPRLVPLSCATASTSTAAHETIPRAPAGTHQVSTAIVEHYQPPAKRARVFSKCNTPGHNTSTCGKQSSFSSSLSSHTYCLSIFHHTYFVYTLSPSPLLIIYPHTFNIFPVIYN